MKAVLLTLISAAVAVNAVAIGDRPTVTRSAERPAWYTQPGDPDWPGWLTIGIPPLITIIPFGPGPEPSCGVDIFSGHTAEASTFCSTFLGGGRTTVTTTRIVRGTTTTSVTYFTTLPRPTSTPAPPPPPPTSRPPVPPSSVAPPPPPPTSSAPAPPPPPPSSSLVAPPPPRSSSPAPPPPPPVSSPPTPSPTPTPVVPSSSSILISSRTSSIASPSPSASSGCGLVGYTKTTQAFNFDGTGTKNTFTACKAACVADSTCKSFGYGEANCLLFNVPADDNVSYNPMSPYTFYDVSCPVELPVRKRDNAAVGQPQILTVTGPGDISSACSCLITSAGPATVRVTRTVTEYRTRTVATTVAVTPLGKK